MKIGLLFLLIVITWCTANQVTNTSIEVKELVACLSKVQKNITTTVDDETKLSNIVKFDEIEELFNQRVTLLKVTELCNSTEQKSVQLFANQYQQNIDIVQTAFDKLNSNEIAMLNKWEKTGDYAEMGKFAIDKLKTLSQSNATIIAFEQLIEQVISVMPEMVNGILEDVMMTNR